jgi:CheY-like chemotaxis protein
LKADPALRDVPVIVVTVVDERGRGLALGATDYFLKPVDRAALLARLARYSFTTKVRERTVRVLAVDDDEAALELVEAALRPEGFEVVAALKADPATRDVPNLILTAHPLSDAEKARLNGKGDDGAAGLRRWLARLPLSTAAPDSDPGPA